jgi:hypothetical protein
MMSSQELTPRSSALSVGANLDIAGPNGLTKVASAGEVIRVDCDGIRSCLDIAAAGPGQAWRHRGTRSLHEALERAQLTLELRALGLLVVRLGRGARPTVWARLARTPGIELGLFGVGVGLLSKLLR